MQKATHLAMGLYIFVFLERLFFEENRLVLFLLVFIGTLFPDIDIITSTLGRKFKIVGEVFKHRGFIHSIYPLILLSLLVHAIWNNYFYTIAFASAYFFHLVLDAFTKMGIKPLWIGPKIRGFTKTGSVVDKFLFVFLIVISILMLFNII